MRPPSERGLAEAERCVDTFARDLLAEASRVAGRRGADEASPDHVAEAAAHLYVSGPNRVTSILSAAGGAVFGAASSTSMSFLLAAPVRPVAAAVSFVVSLVGAVAMTSGLMRRR